MRELKVDVPGVSAYYDEDLDYVEFFSQGEEIVCWYCSSISGARTLVEDFERICQVGIHIGRKTSGGS